MVSVLHVHNPAGVASHLVETQRRKGIDADLIVVHDPFEYGYDYKYRSGPSAESDDIFTRVQSIFSRFVQTLRVCQSYDIVHFHGSSSLDYSKPFFPRGIDELAYKLKDTKVVMHYHGGNVRGIGEPLLHRTFADRQLVSTPDLLQWVKNAKWVPNPVDINDIPHTGVQNQDPPYTICHAPTDRETKGTDSIISAVEKLSRSGYDVRLDLIESVSRQEALQRLAKADIVVDQLKFGWYGLVSIESLALGKPTCVYINPDVKPPEFQSPLINITQSNLSEKLQYLIENPDYRNDISNRSRRFVETVHDPEAVTEQINQMYQQIL